MYRVGSEKARSNTEIPINSNLQYGEINAGLMQIKAIKGVIVADTEKQYDMGSATGFVVLDTKAGGSIPNSCFSMEWPRGYL